MWLDYDAKCLHTSKEADTWCHTHAHTHTQTRTKVDGKSNKNEILGNYQTIMMMTTVTMSMTVTTITMSITPTLHRTKWNSNNFNHTTEIMESDAKVAQKEDLQTNFRTLRMWTGRMRVYSSILLSFDWYCCYCWQWPRPRKSTLSI